MEFFNQNLYDEIRYFNNEKDFLDDFIKMKNGILKIKLLLLIQIKMLMLLISK